MKAIVPFGFVMKILKLTADDVQLFIDECEMRGGKSFIIYEVRADESLWLDVQVNGESSSQQSEVECFRVDLVEHSICYQNIPTPSELVSVKA